MELDGNSGFYTATNVRLAEMGLAASHKMKRAICSEVCNAAYARWIETELAASDVLPGSF